MVKKLFILMVVVVIVVVGILIAAKDHAIISKNMSVVLEQDTDYGEIDQHIYWNYGLRDELRNYIKDNNLMIKAGRYNLTTRTTFEEALEIFDFIKKH